MHSWIHRCIPFVFLLLSQVSIADSSQIEFSDGWIKDLPPVVPMRAGYLTIENRGQQAVRITGLQSDAFARVELHETVMQDGLMRMVEIENLEIAPGAVVELKPGGKHLMLIAPLTALEPGAEIELSVDFDDGGSLKTQLPIRSR